MKLATDYARHDRRYEELRASGQKGWSADAADLRARCDWVRAQLGVGGPLNARVLFLGCGAGEYVIDAAVAGARSTGIDISKVAIAMAREAASAAGVGADFHVGSVLELPFAAESFDLVVDDHCLHCIIGPDRGAVLAQARRVLQPGGALLIQTMCSPLRNPNPTFVHQYDPQTRCQIVDGVAMRYFGEPATIEAEVEAAGLQILRREILTEETDVLQLEARRR